MGVMDVSGANHPTSVTHQDLFTVSDPACPEELEADMWQALDGLLLVSAIFIALILLLFCTLVFLFPIN